MAIAAGATIAVLPLRQDLTPREITELMRVYLPAPSYYVGGQQATGCRIAIATNVSLPQGVSAHVGTPPRQSRARWWDAHRAETRKFAARGWSAKPRP
jgi:hypothetical protein